MGRNKTNVKIQPYQRNYLQAFADYQATIGAIFKYFKDIEYGELIENQHDMAARCCNKLCLDLNIKGEVDMDFITNLYNEYKDTDRLTKEGKLLKIKDGE